MVVPILVPGFGISDGIRLKPAWSWQNAPVDGGSAVGSTSARCATPVPSSHGRCGPNRTGEGGRERHELLGPRPRWGHSTSFGSSRKRGAEHWRKQPRTFALPRGRSQQEPERYSSFSRRARSSSRTRRTVGGDLVFGSVSDNSASRQGINFSLVPRSFGSSFCSMASHVSRCRSSPSHRATYCSMWWRSRMPNPRPERANAASRRSTGVPSLRSELPWAASAP